MLAVRNNNRTPKDKNHCAMRQGCCCAMGSYRPPIVAQRTHPNPLCIAQQTHSAAQRELFKGYRPLLWHKPRRLRNRGQKAASFREQVRATIERYKPVVAGTKERIEKWRG
jgi:hypothetical protein